MFAVDVHRDVLLGEGLLNNLDGLMDPDGLNCETPPCSVRPMPALSW